MKYQRQTFTNDCGATCLSMILEFFGKKIPVWEILEKFPVSKKGWSLHSFLDACCHYGINTNAVPYSHDLISNIKPPYGVLYKSHYIFVHKIDGKKIHVADPRIGKIKYNPEEFVKEIDTDSIFIQFFCGVDFTEKKNFSVTNVFRNFINYYIPYKAYLFEILILLFIISFAQAIIPFLSRAIIDSGVESSSWEFIKVLGASIIVLTLTMIGGEFLQTYLVTHICNRVKIQMLNDYLKKSFLIQYIQYLGLNVGDMLQRISDNERVQNFVVSSLMQALTSFCFLIVYAIVLAVFSLRLTIVFIAMIIIYFSWNLLFIQERKNLDFDFWKSKSENNRSIIDSFIHFTDIRLFSLEQLFMNKWKSNLLEILNQNTKYLRYTQLQSVGNQIILQGNNLLLTFFSCYYVISGSFTLGTLFAIQYLIGIMYSPLYNIVDFFNQTQLTYLSLRRIQSFNNLAESPVSRKLSIMPKYKHLYLQGVCYKYPNGKFVLNQIHMKMEYGGKYAFIGSSGCGKSTLIKLLCGLINPVAGKYFIDSINVQSLNVFFLNNLFSVYIQDNSLFNGTIMQNIVGSNSEYNEDRFFKVIEIASIRKEIEELPMAYLTVVGENGISLSKGQQQRILLARTLYKVADIYIFDEITNFLENSRGMNIVEKIDSFLYSKTRIYVTHQLNTIKDSKLIYYLREGYLVDYGSYDDLVKRKRINNEKN